MITGAVKFFEQNLALLKEGSTVVASTNNDGATSMIDTNKYTRWESLASNDSISEEIILTFPSETVIDRIFLLT